MPQYRSILITGASSGIGESLAREYIQSGAYVGVCGRDIERVQSVCEGSPRALPLVFDVTDSAACAQAISRFQAFAGNIDLAILNAGYHEATDAAAFNLQTYTKLMQINYIGTLNCLAPVIEQMKRRRNGAIALMGSAAGLIGMPNAGAYCASKSAINRLAESLKVELKTFKIDIRLITPGFVKTPLTARNDFPMPFLMSVEAATERIRRGLSGRRYEIAFPKRLIWSLRIASILPRWLYFLLARNLLPADRPE